MSIESMSFSLAVSQPAEAEARSSVLHFEDVYRQHFANVWRVLRRLGVADAQLDDAAQDVFVVVHRRLADVDARGASRSWLYAIAVRVASEHRRRASRQQTEPLPDMPDAAANPARQSELREAVRLLHTLLSELDDDKRTVFVLSELEQLSVPEIADVLGVNLNTAYSRLRAARKRFDAAHARQKARAAKGQRP